MNLDEAIKQINISKQALTELQNQQRGFETVLSETIKRVPEEHKKEIAKVQLMYQNAIKLSKEGKYKEAQELISETQKKYGRQG